MRCHKCSGPSQSDIEASWVLGTESEWLWGSWEASWVLRAESEWLIGVGGDQWVVWGHSEARLEAILTPSSSKIRPIAFHAHTMISVELNYNIYNKELLTI